MLTKKHNLLSARLTSQVGERRPGFLDSEASFLKGPEPSYQCETLSDCHRNEPIVYKRVIISDPETGEKRFDKKE